MSFTGRRGRGFFLRSGLPPAILGQIWQLADTDKDGRLNAAEFSVAMHLVDLALKGVPPPPSLPPPLRSCVEGVVRGRLPAMDDDHVIKCQSAFLAFKSDIATGTLGSELGRE